MRHVLAAWLMCSLYGCGIIGPSCVDAQKTGPVFSLNGEVAAGGLAVHQFRTALRAARTTVRSGGWATPIRPGRGRACS